MTNREDVIRMAREACDTDKVDAWHNDFWTITQEELERFANLVAEHERERCACTVERARLQLDGHQGLTHETDHIATRIVDFLAEQVRSIGHDRVLGLRFDCSCLQCRKRENR